MLAHFFLWHLKGRLGEKSTSADGVAAPPVIPSCVAPTCVYDWGEPRLCGLAPTAQSPGVSCTS